MASERYPGPVISPSNRIAYSALIRRIWTAAPGLTIDQVKAESKAPRCIVLEVRRRLVKAGVLESHNHLPRKEPSHG